MNNDIYIIKDLTSYATEARKSVVLNIFDGYVDDIDDFITLNETLDIIKNNCFGIDENNSLLLNEETNQKIYEKIGQFIYGIQLSRMCTDGILECAWDSESNNMIFWNPELGDKNAQQYESRGTNTKS